MKNNFVATLLKGFAIGSSMMVPGVSGGTMAIMLGIYSDLIGAINSIRKNFKKSFIFLLIFCIGSVAGMFLLATPLSYLVKNYNTPTMYFFIGAIAGSIPLIYHQSGVRKISLGAVIYPLIGFSIIISMDFIPKGLIPNASGGGIAEFAGLFIAGIVAAVALILPGISLTHILLLMGLYGATMDAISTVNIPYLIPLALGLLIGIFATTKILDNLMSKFPKATFLIILGFIIASVIEIFPKVVPVGIDLFICLTLFAVGFFTMYKLSLLRK